MAELLILHSYPYDRPDAAQRASGVLAGARAVLNTETDEWDILVNSKTMRAEIMAQFVRDGSGAHVGCSSEARKSAKKAIRTTVELLGRAADESEYELKDLEGL